MKRQERGAWFTISAAIAALGAVLIIWMVIDGALSNVRGGIWSMVIERLFGVSMYTKEDYWPINMDAGGMEGFLNGLYRLMAGVFLTGVYYLLMAVPGLLVPPSRVKAAIGIALALPALLHAIRLLVLADGNWQGWLMLGAVPAIPVAIYLFFAIRQIKVAPQGTSGSAPAMQEE